jgi:hypothetical protein
MSNSRRTLIGIELVYHGHEGVRQFWRDALSVFAEADLEVDSFCPAPGAVPLHKA